MSDDIQDHDDVPLIMPDLGLDDVSWSACQWLARLGAEVQQGDRILEVLGGDVAVDLPAPVTGRLCRKLVAEEQQLQPGQALAYIRQPPN